MKKKISIGLQVFMALGTVIIIMSALFSPYGFYTNISSIRKSLDERLSTAANGVQEFMGDEYCDNVLEGKISDTEYSDMQKKLVEFQKRIGVTFLYAAVQKPDGKIYYILDQTDPLLNEYAEPSRDTLQAFKDKKPVYAQCEDAEYGLTARTVLLPFVSPKGNFYVVGADMNVKNIRPLIIKSFIDFSLLIFVGLILVLFVTARLTKQISLPIEKLSKFTQKLSDSNFAPDIDMSETVPASIIKTREVGILASSIKGMMSKLGEYIENLKKEEAARNMAESELKIAGDIQKSFLPGKCIENDFLCACADMKTAKRAGGDLYDFFEMSDGRICFAIGDVSGKGMPAALFMARAMTLIRSAAHINLPLSKSAEFINDILSESNDSCTFITFFICAYDRTTGILEFVNCGHNPPYLKTTDGEVRMLELKKNRVLGVFGGLPFENETLKLEAGDMLFAYTDGVTEALDSSSKFYGDERLENLLKNAGNGISPDKIVRLVMDSVAKFSEGCEQSDDITVLALKRKL